MGNDLVRLVTQTREKYKTINLKPVEDPLLSWKATGLHTWLISRPDDWDINLEYIYKQASDGKTSVNTCIQELKYYNYLYVYRPRNEQGQYTGESEWYVTEDPEELPVWDLAPVSKELVLKQGPDSWESEGNEPVSGNPDSGQPNSGNSHLGQSASTREELSTKEEEKTTKEEINTTTLNPSSAEEENGSSPDLDGKVGEVVVDGEPLRKKLENLGEQGMDDLEPVLKAVRPDLPENEAVLLNLLEKAENDDSVDNPPGWIHYVLTNNELSELEIPVSSDIAQKQENAIQKEMTELTEKIENWFEEYHEPLPENEIPDWVSDESLNRLKSTGRLVEIDGGLLTNTKLDFYPENFGEEHGSHEDYETQ